MADHKRIRREDGSPRSTADSGSEGDDDSDTGAGGRAGPARGGTAAGSQDATADFMRQSQAAQQSARRSRGRRSRPSATPAEDSEDSGEDIMENMESDYRVIPELDRYDDELLDDAEHEELDIAERQAVDEMLAQRDAKEHRPRMSSLPAALESSDDDDDDVNDAFVQQQQILRDQETGAFGAGEPDDYDESEPFNLDSYASTPLSQWIGFEGPRRELKRQFGVFLTTFTESDDDAGIAYYREKINQMCTANRQSLHVSYVHLSQYMPTVSIWLADEPKEMLELFNEAAQREVLKDFPNYKDTHERVLVRITNLPVHDSLRELREVHLNALIKVSGVVTRRTGVFPQLTVAYYNCKHCGALVGPKPVKDREEPRIPSCPDCQSAGPFEVNHEKTIYRNYQRVTIQESPGSVPAGRVPRRKECVLTDDLIDSARPGQEVEVTGIYTHSFDAALNTRQGFPVFATIIVANYVRSKEDVFSTTLLTKEDKRHILKLSRDPKIGSRIINSIAPSIYGMDHVKTAIALSLFGGREKITEKHRIRGDINVLLLGDPGVAKSQFLKYVQKTAPRAIYTTGKGASAVGLTAGVHRDPLTKEWTLEGGALVLADRGVCMIDEFDKMNDQDRTSIHEAMEQQSISISKAGLVTTLQARCAVLAAANPIGGRYDTSRTLAENVTLTDPILQRFDILCVCLDSVDPVSDERLARFVTRSHMASHPATSAAARAAAAQDPWGVPTSDHLDPGEEDGGADVGGAGGVGVSADDDPNDDVVENGKGEKLDQDILRKYLIYARTHCNPQLHDINQDKLTRLYADLRNASDEVGGVPIAVRHIESILRMAEAHARMHLRDFVQEDDVNMAIQVILTSFIGAQKFSVMSVLRKRFKRYLWHNHNNDAILLHVLGQLIKEQRLTDLAFDGGRDDDDDDADISTTIAIRLDLFEMKAKENGVDDVTDFLKSPMFRRDFAMGEDSTGNLTITKVL